MAESGLRNWNGQDFVLVVDYYSRYMDIEKLYKTNSATFVKKLKHIFWRMRIPEVMRSDNGPQYSSSIFKKYVKDWRFQHITSGLEYPKCNDLAEKTVQAMKSLLEKAKDNNKGPHLTVLEARNTSAGNYRSPTELAIDIHLRSVLPVNPNNLKIKTISNDEFKEKRRKYKDKESKYYDERTKEMKALRYGEAVRLLRDGKWEPATVLEKADEPRSYILKTQNGRTYRRNRGHILKIEVDEDDSIEISDNDDEEETSEENVTVQNDDRLKDVKQEESEVNDTNEREDANDTIQPEKIRRSGSVLGKQKRLKIMELFRR